MATYRLQVPRVTRTSSGGAAHDIMEGLHFIRRNSAFSFLMRLTFFHSLFGTAYIMLMPVFAVDILEIGADGQGLLLGVGAIGALATTFWLATRSNDAPKAMLIIIGGVMSGISVAAFAITAEYVGSFALALVLMVIVGIFNTAFITATQSSLQMMVPDEIRGRVMGFYGMTYSIRPLGGVQASVLASISIIGAPIAIAIGGVAVAVFATASALMNRNLRALDAPSPESAASQVAGEQTQPLSPSTLRPG